MKTTSKLFLPAIAISLTLAVAGCGKKLSPAQTSQSVAPAAEATGTTTDPVAARPAPVLNPVTIPNPAASDAAPTLAALTQALRKYTMEHKGLPQSFSVIVHAGYVRNLPAPPPGKKFAIEAKTASVVLVNP